MDARGPRQPLLALLAVVACVSTACASGGETKEAREPLPPRTVAPPRPEPPPSEPPVATPAPPTTIVVPAPEEESPSDAPSSLIEASRRERERRRSAEPPVAVINDKNLAEYAEGETLTVAEPAAGPDGAAAEGEEEPTADGKNEAWWRERGLEIRKRWKEATEDVTRLEGEAAALRTKFYSADDPYLRDSQIKPQWDRVLAELDETRRRADAGPEELADYFEEGRRAGALPGWLREGVDLEPFPVSTEPEPAQPVEPVEVVEPERPPA
jgi:hypothetical protein